MKMTLNTHHPPHTTTHPTSPPKLNFLHKKRFTQKGNLEEHKRAVHEGVKFPCTQCDKRFNHKGNLEEHKRAVHEGVKFPCTQCDKRFTKKGYLEEHKRAVHEGVKFPCTQFFYTSTVRGENISMIKWTFKSSLFISFNRCYYTGFKAVFKFITLNIFP